MRVCCPQVSSFADRVERQIFSPSTPLEIIANCLGFVREQAVKTQEQHGLDLTYMLDSRFRRNIERTVSGGCHTGDPSWIFCSTQQGGKTIERTCGGGGNSEFYLG